jgi:hypothetical protein
VCLAVDPLYRRGVWDLKLYAACPIHRVWLVEECPECERVRDWRSIGVSSCKCGFDYREAIAEPCSDHVAALVGEIARRFDPALQLPQTSIQLTPDLASLSPADLLQVIAVLGYYATKHLFSESLIRLSARDARAIITNAAELLADWPKRFCRLIDRRTRRKLGSYNDLSKIYGESVAALLRRTEKTAAETFIVNGVLRHVELAHIRTGRQIFGQLLTEECRVWMSAEAAAALLEFRWESLQQRIASGELRHMEGGKEKRRRQLWVRVDDVRRLRAMRNEESRELVTFQQAGSTLGVIIRTVGKLIDAELIGENRGNFIRRRILKKDVENLLARLRSLVKSGPKGQKLIPIRALYSSPRSVKLAKVIQYILDGEIVPRRWSRSDPGIHGLRFDRDALDKMRQLKKNE